MKIIKEKLENLEQSWENAKYFSERSCDEDWGAEGSIRFVYIVDSDRVHLKC